MAVQHPRGGASGAFVAGRYRLDDLLGGTARTEVWAGHDAVLERPVTVKLVHAGGLAVGAARLALPGVVAVYDVTDHEGLAVVVTERIDATPLDRLLDEHPVLTAADAATIVGAVARILEATHAAGVPHGAVRPSNVLVCTDMAVLLTDFRGGAGGEPGPFDARPDLDALTALLAELLAHCHREGVPAHLRRLVDRALSPTGSAAPVGMLEFRMALRPAGSPADADGTPRGRPGLIVLALLVLAASGAAVAFTSALLDLGWTMLGWD